MGGYRLNTFVHAVEVDAKGARTGRDKVFGPDDDMSAPENEWALAAITNDAVWADEKVPDREPPAPAQDDEVALLKARIAELEEAQRHADSAGSEGASPAKDRYDGMTAAQLGDELGDRKLSKSGSKPDLIARLRADDEAKKSAPPQ
jgi:hypothetical protein